MAWTTPVVDRTAADALAVKAGDFTNLKGQFTADDLNRIYWNLDQLLYWIFWYDFTSEEWYYRQYHYTPQMRQLEALGPVKTNWNSADLFNEANLAELYRQIGGLRDVYPVYPTTPVIPTDLTSFSYLEANAVEQILQDIYETFVSAWNSFKRSGYNFNCGETEGDFRW